MTQQAPPASPDTATPNLARQRGLPRMQEMGLIVVIVLISVFLSIASPAVVVGPPFDPAHQLRENGFLRADNLLNSVFTVMSWMAIMAIGQTIVIISGGIDISVGSAMGLAAFVTALVLRSFPVDAPWWQTIPIGMAVPIGVGLACGLINGSLVVGLRMHPFIVSLATLSIFRWVTLKLGDTYGSSQPGNLKVPYSFTNNFIAYGTQRVRVPPDFVVETYQFIPIVFMLICLAAGWIYLRHTVWGRETYAIGGNEEAARFSGIRINLAKLRVYMLCGLSAGIAGMLSCGVYKSAQTVTGDGYELDVIAMAVVGGASLTGGRGTALGAVLGALILQLIIDAIPVLGQINLGFVQIPVVQGDKKLIMGVSILIAVAIDQFTMRQQSRRSAQLKSTAH